tara:strand:+ start:390 stop:1040 length:651 start_codon:yes stop_codon:yes gene_type:complete
MPKKVVIVEPEETEIIEETPIKLTKKGQKPRTLTPEQLDRLKLAREKAREAQIKNTALRKLERENKAHDNTTEKVKREKAIKEKNKEIKDALNVVKIEKRGNRPVSDTDKGNEEDVSDNNASVVGEDYEEEVKPVNVVKKKKPKKKPVIIVEASSDSDSDDNQVIYIKKKKKKEKVERIVEPPPPPPPAPEPEIIQQPIRRYPINPFFNHNNFKKY